MLPIISQTFLGNIVETQVVKHKLLRPITARYVRFLAKTYVNRICLRVELYGRRINEKIIPGRMSDSI